jgi:hypothetical protein
VGTDDGITLVRERLFRAILTCTTCRIVVAVGPTSSHEPLAAYELGRADGACNAGILHLGVCAGGALDVSIEEVPNPAPFARPSSPRTRGLRSV